MLKNFKKTEKQSDFILVTSISNLTPEQKNNISNWLYEIYYDYYINNHQIPAEERQHHEIIKKLLDKIKQANISIPEKQIQLYYASKQTKYLKRLAKEFPEIIK
ncbi:MAG: hypothetical protein HDT22_00710 [Ruminococcus sp.]|nr:hypothetical protein [Ruminococcus sp.]